jgi:steroid 5-alpha reductase family enzyme
MNIFYSIGIVVFIYMNLWFVFSLFKKRNDFVDVAWGMGFVLIAWVSFILESNFNIGGLIVNILVSIWGLRLAWHIYIRNKNKTEDPRYLAWRNEWGKYFYIRSYFQIYILQGFLMFLIALPVIIINSSGLYVLSVLNFVGMLVWIVGFYFEYKGDAELATFLKDPNNKGKIIQSGLWAYTRHPNYFGEVTQWWGIWVMSFGIPYFYFGIIGPLTITFLILKVSGIPMLEKRMAENPEFVEYKKRVSMFFPMP